MLQDTIVKYLKDHIEPILDLHGHKAYRCSVTLKDGLYLPCILMKSEQQHVNMALDAFRDSRKEGITDSSGGNQFDKYWSLLRSYVVGGNRLSWHHIASIDRSPFAIPMDKIKEIQTEPNLTWIAFSGVMDDGKVFSFGTPFATEFFEMPQGYDARRIVRIDALHNRNSSFFREKTYFECYLDGL